MIRCTLELIPGGVGEPERLGVIEISNDILTSLKNPRRGTYSFKLFKKRKQKYTSGKIKSFPRLSYHPWNLILRILEQAAEKNGGVI
jgi:hypothetical protein